MELRSSLIDDISPFTDPPGTSFKLSIIPEVRAPKKGQEKTEFPDCRHVERSYAFGMVLRPGETYDSNPAIYRRVREHRDRVREGRLNAGALYQPRARPDFKRPSGTRSNSKHQYRR
jgi:hypothetical protein